MKKLLSALAASIGMATVVHAQNGITANDFQYQQQVLISNLLVNAGMSTNTLPVASANPSTPFVLHGDSTTIGIFVNGQWNVPSGAGGTNQVTLNFLPAIDFVTTNGAGSALGYLIQTNLAPSSVIFTNLAGTNTGVLYGQLWTTNFYGAHAFFLSSIGQTNANASGTFTVIGGGFH